MNTEYEIRILEINKEKFIKKIMSLGARHIGDFDQKRYVYDVKPFNPDKWIRLRTNGKNTTITIKELKKRSIDGTRELEITVDDFDKSNMLLEELGYKNKGFQENKRSEYILDDIHIDIDTWPLVPTYVELEGLNEESVINMINKLGYKEEDCTTMCVMDIYRHYGYDIDNMPNLSFNMEE